MGQQAEEPHQKGHGYIIVQISTDMFFYQWYLRPDRHVALGLNGCNNEFSR